jgi:hypothetical protein
MKDEAVGGHTSLNFDFELGLSGQRQERRKEQSSKHKDSRPNRPLHL